MRRYKERRGFAGEVNGPSSPRWPKSPIVTFDKPDVRHMRTSEDLARSKSPIGSQGGEAASSRPLVRHKVHVQEGRVVTATGEGGTKFSPQGCEARLQTRVELYKDLQTPDKGSPARRLRDDDGRVAELQNRLDQFYAAANVPETARCGSGKIAAHFVDNVPALNGNLLAKYGKTLDDVVTSDVVTSAVRSVICAAADDDRVEELRRRLERFYAAMGSTPQTHSDSAQIAEQFADDIPALNAKLLEKYGKGLDDVVPAGRRLGRHKVDTPPPAPPPSALKSTQNILLVGFDPAIAEFFGTTGLQHELDKQKALIEADARRRLVYCFLDARGTSSKSSMERLQEQICSERWSLVVVGAGVRCDPACVLLFEEVVNMVLQLAPGVPVAFDMYPTDTKGAVERWLGSPDSGETF